jgi:hypothetical protein
MLEVMEVTPWKIESPAPPVSPSEPKAGQEDDRQRWSWRLDEDQRAVPKAECGVRSTKYGKTDRYSQYAACWKFR